MLVKLLKEHLKPYQAAVVAVIVLQLVQTIATLYLPSLNAKIIDKGVAKRRHRVHPAASAASCSASRLVQVRLRGRRGLLRRQGRRWRSGATCARRSSTRCRRSPPGRSATFGAPSLITRITNDVQQVQMLVLMACTHGRRGADHDRRRRHHGGAPGRRAVGGPAGRPCRCSLHRARLHRLADGPAVPADAGAHRPRQPGAARADHRHPRRAGVRARARRDGALRRRQRPTSPTTSLRGRPADGADVPDGHARAQRVERRRAVVRRATASTAGDIQIGSLVAFLSYLAQILMSVMMATFMVVDDPARRRVAPSASRRCSTPTQLGRRRPQRRSRTLRRRTARSSCATSASTTRAPSMPCCTDVSFDGRAGQDDGDHRQHRRGQDDARQPRPAPVRRDRGRGARRRRRRARPRPRAAVERDRARPAEALPLLRHGRVATCATASPTPPTRRCGHALEVAQAADFVRGHARRARRAHRAGRHQRVGRAAPTPGHRAGAGPRARHLPVRRLVLGARPRHRRPAARRAGAGHAGRDRDHRRPACRRPSGTPTRSSCSRTAGGRARDARRAARRPARRTPRSWSRRSSEEEAA